MTVWLIVSAMSCDVCFVLLLEDDAASIGDADKGSHPGSNTLPAG